MPYTLTRIAGVVMVISLMLIAPLGFANETLPGLTMRPTPDGGEEWSFSLQTLVLITSLTFIPAALLMLTSFTRIIIVLSLLRTALGTPTAPPNQVMLGMALFLTFFVMAPVFEEIYEIAWLPYTNSEISLQDTFVKGAEPLKAFMLNQVREADVARFVSLAGIPPIESTADVPLKVLIPAFITSELKTAFQIGFMIFFPFLIIDLVIASVLMALGMMMVPPATISLPFKLILFVLVDGWQLLMGSLAASFTVG